MKKINEKRKKVMEIAKRLVKNGMTRKEALKKAWKSVKEGKRK